MKATWILFLRDAIALAVVAAWSASLASAQAGVAIRGGKLIDAMEKAALFQATRSTPRRVLIPGSFERTFGESADL